MKPICDHEDCDYFGKQHPQCTAHVKATRDERADRRGTACRRYPSPGLTVCVKHGGGQPKARKAGTARRAEEKARAAVAAYGLPRDVSPTEALLEEVRWSAGHVAWLRDRVARFDQGPEPLTIDAEGRALLDVYADERDRLVRIAKTTLDAGVEERRVQLAESQGALVAGAIRRILVRLNLTAEQEALVGVVVPSELRALAGGGEQ